VGGGLGIKQMLQNLKEGKGLKQNLGVRKAIKANQEGELELLYECKVRIHLYPPPSPPRNLTLFARTATAFSMIWETPLTWGGCALLEYELEYREITNKGVTKEWKAGVTVDAERTTGAIPANVYMADVRARARNVGSVEASEWSEVLQVKTEADEKAALAATKHGGMLKGTAFSGSRQELVAMLSRENSVAGTMSEVGMAVVTQVSLADMFGANHVIPDAAEMADWSPFKRCIGDFFSECGTFGGFKGMLFDFNPQQVEDLATNGEDIIDDDEDKPLLSFVVAATWVLQTLAQHSEDCDVWVPLVNEVAALVRLGSCAPETEQTQPMIKGLLYSLIDIYESLRMCGEDGYIHRQLAYKYPKPLKALLKSDWQEQRQRLKNDVATNVMGLVLYDRALRHKTGMLEATVPIRKTKSVSGAALKSSGSATPLPRAT